MVNHQPKIKQKNKPNKARTRKRAKFRKNNKRFRNKAAAN